MRLKDLLIGSSVLIAGAAIVYRYKKTIPCDVTAVKPFDVKKFTGKWNELARLDFFFEKNLDYATAEYTLNDDGSIKVINRGYNYKKQKEEAIEGKAIFVGDENEGKLRVSFWGPFYSGYNVIAIDEKYKHALIAGKNKNYLWFLSKEKEMPEKIMNEYLELAESLGFNTSKLLWTNYK